MEPIEEVKNMLLTEYNEAKQMQLFKEDGRREGIEEGVMKTLISLVKDGVLTIKDAAARASITETAFQQKMQAPEFAKAYEKIRPEIDAVREIKYPFFTYKEETEGHTYWVAKSRVLKGCVGQGDTLDAAIGELAVNENDWLEEAKEFGIAIPAGSDHEVVMEDADLPSDVIYEHGHPIG